MKKIVSILLVSCFFFYSRPAYAVFDFISIIEDAIELVSDLQHKVIEIQNKIAEIKKRVAQGFELAGDCLSNPGKCDMEALGNFAGDVASAIQNGSDFISGMTGSAIATATNNLMEYESESLEDNIRDTYIYKRGTGDDLTNLNKNRQGLNGVAINDTNALFAKAAATRHSILQEEDTIYQTDFGDAEGQNVEKIIRAQTVVALYTQARLARILELRANMVGADATLELTQQAKEPEEQGQ